MGGYKLEGAVDWIHLA